MTVELDSSPTARGGAWPPGFRFHPTDEELILYYLKRKICRKKLMLNIIAELDVYRWDPEELPGQSLLKTGDRQWYFFSSRDRRYPNARSNRATRHGYWKATGKDRCITSNSCSVGVKKTLVFYKGRAPGGQRTDWVMHEYTLDEEELKRCQNVKDYYALYKLFKKSGPGPKNGEQYGAPFKEEEWDDDDSEVVNTVNDGKEILPRPLLGVSSVDNVTDGSQLQPASAYDMEEFLNQYMPELNGPPIDSFIPTPVLPQSLNEEAQSSLLIPPATGFSLEPVHAFNSNEPQPELQPSFEFNSMGISQSQQQEAASVLTCVPDNNIPHPPFCEDFVEIEDLIGSTVPTFGNIEKPLDNSPFEQVEGLSELDLFHDAAMFLCDIGPLDQVNTTAPGLSIFDYGIVNESNCQVQQYPSLVADQSANQSWVHDQRGDAFTFSESIQGVQLHPSGFVNDSVSNNLSAANQNLDGGEEVTGRMSQFSSAIWAFVESIPTNPASASDNVLVNRALERMTSFSRVRLNSVAARVGSVSGTAVVRRSRKSSRGFVLFYVVGVLVSLFGVLIGTLRLWERCASS